MLHRLRRPGAALAACGCAITGFAAAKLLVSVHNKDATSSPDSSPTPLHTNLAKRFSEHFAAPAHASLAAAPPRAPPTLLRALRQCATAECFDAAARAHGVDLDRHSANDVVEAGTGRSLLVTCALRGCHAAVFRRVLAAARDANERDPLTGLSLLSLLIMHGSEAHVRALLDDSGGAAARGGGGARRFDVAAAMRTPDAFGLLPIHKAVAFNRAAMVRRLVKDVGVDVDTPTVDANEVRSDGGGGRGGWEEQPVGETALHIAARGGNARMVALLLALGADAAATCPVTGNTPLHVACARNADTKEKPNTSNYECVQLLLNANSEVATKRNAKGLAPAELAPPALRLLLRSGALNAFLDARFKWHAFIKQKQ